MASFNTANASNYCNVPTVVGAELSSISRDGKSVTFTYRAYIYQSTDVWSKNTFALWVEGTQYNVKGTEQSVQGKKYYSGYKTKTVSLAVGTTSTTVSIGVNGNYWSPTSPAGYVTLTLSGIPTCTKPTLNAMTSSEIKDNSAKLSFSVKNTNNGSITAYGIQVSTSNFGTVIESVASYNSTISGLDANRTYYARGYATNAAGTTYTPVISFKTTFTNPGNPGAPILTYDQTEPIPEAILKATWTAASAGSTAVAGYRIRLFKNNKEVRVVDTDSTAVTYTFGPFEDLGFAVGDVAKVGIYAYSLDWNNVKHLNGDGAASAQVFSSNRVTVISDKYVYASVNGSTFTKYKMYVSQNGDPFVEVKKEKFKVI